MATLQDAWDAMVDAIIADNSLSRGDAGAVIEGFGPEMRGADARNWIDAVAVEYNRLGIINNTTYSNLRNSHIVADGAAAAKALFMALNSAILALAETAVVNNAIIRQDLSEQLAEITTSQATINGFKTGATPQVLRALDDADAFLVRRRAEIESQLV